MSWTIDYWAEKEISSLSKWFDSLTKEQFKSIAKELKLLERCGNTLRLPHSRALGRGLFELRERTFGLRIYYTFAENQMIILLCAGSKTTQEKDIKTAYARLDGLKRGKNK